MEASSSGLDFCSSRSSHANRDTPRDLAASPSLAKSSKKGASEKWALSYWNGIRVIGMDFFAFPDDFKALIIRGRDMFVLIELRSHE